MIPVTQTKVSVSNSKGETIIHGNCFPSAIASMLELPLSEVPNFEIFYQLPEGDDFYLDVLDRFLKHKGFELETDGRFCVFHDWNYGVEDGSRADLVLNLAHKFYMVSGKSPRGLQHICIYRNGKLVHDPHPSREGLITLDHFQTLVPIK